MLASSRITSARRLRLSVDFRLTSNSWKALRREPQFDRTGVRLEPLGLAERHRRGTQNPERLGVALEQRGALHEVEDAQARGETRRSRGRQDVVRAADVIADRLGRLGP